MSHQTVLKINEESKSFSNGQNYHVGQKGLDVEFTVQPGWVIKTEIISKDGYQGLRVYAERI